MAATGTSRAAAAFALAVAAAMLVGGAVEARNGNRGVQRATATTSYYEERWGDWSVTTYQDGQEVYEAGGYRSVYESYNTWSE
jgi:hypothetical protein